MSDYGMIFLLTHFPPPFSRRSDYEHVSFMMYDTTCEGILNGSIGCCVCATVTSEKKILCSNQWKGFFILAYLFY